jgi:hypothetical protein
MFFTNALYITLGILLLYLLFVIGNSIDIKLKRDKEARISNLIIAFIVLHFSYGFGSLKGLFDILRGKYKIEKSNK